ncbi:zinc-binding dehydrogenase [Mycobacterium sp. DL440]|uniref:zinc-binding dehydrogenase n=1 Tax=Mycobacterium sp. DL440 TaxID=2675523 RepID=UPI001FBBB310|nr:zinc-binding dehydrogenase [Mycobacterium sp. DL440]
MTKTSAAVWSGVDAGFSLRQEPLPQLRDGEVLVGVELATICGSDLHTINGDRPTPLPTVLGHEAVGTVVATGGPVNGHDGQPIGPGDRITWTIGTACGQCRRCRRGLSQKCLSVRKYGHEAIDEHWRFNGGLATHCHLLAGTGLVRVPDALPAALAAPANCATATVVCAARRVGLGADDVVIVQGCGMLGLTAIAYARDAGVRHVIACDVEESRREAAVRFGATSVCAPDQLSSAAQEYGADVILELSGSSRAVQSALEVIDVGGRIALVGSVSPAPEISFEPSGYVKNLTTLVGCHNYRLDDLAEAVDFLARTEAQQLFADLVSPPYPLADIDAAVAAARGGVAPRVAVAMR